MAGKTFGKFPLTSSNVFLHHGRFIVWDHKGRIIYFLMGEGGDFGKKIACRLERSKINFSHHYLCENIVCRKETKNIRLYNCKKLMTCFSDNNNNINLNLCSIPFLYFNGTDST